MLNFLLLIPIFIRYKDPHNRHRPSAMVISPLHPPLEIFS